MGGVVTKQGHWWTWLVDEPTSVYGRRDIGTRPTNESWNECLDSDMYTSRNGQRTIVTRAAMGAVNGVSGEGHRWTVG